MLRALALLLLLPMLARADAPGAYCGAGSVRQLSVVRGRVTATVKLALPSTFDPTATGATFGIAYEPEAEPGNDLLRVDLPAPGWKRTRKGFTYRDPAAAGGVRRVLLVRSRDGMRAVIERTGAPLAGLRSGTLRVALGSEAACGRTCAATCTRKGSRLRCRAGRDDALCGVMSGCELLGTSEGQTTGHCLLPYPSDAFNVPDPTTPTGMRHAYARRTLPVTNDGVHIDPTPWKTLDGFSPGAQPVAHFPQGVDLAASRVPAITDVAASLDPASPTLIVAADAAGCQRVPHFGENDVSADAAGLPIAPPRQALFLRPMRRLANATRYVVALRKLTGQDGRPIDAPTGFAALRDGTPVANRALEARRARTTAVIAKLEADCGIDRKDLVLAWDFTTASDDNLQRWLLHMRDATFGELGAAAPAFTVTSVEDDPVGDPRICRRVRGTFSVPLWTTADAPGARLRLDPATNLPVRSGAATAPVTAIIPCSLVNGPTHTGRPIVYGHGLLGAGDSEISDAPDLRDLANNHGFVVIATDWQGMSRADLGAIVDFIGDLSGFPVLPERLHQGILNTLVLAHLVGAADGLATHAAFRTGDGTTPYFDRSAVYFYGNSMGGIYGLTFMTLSQEITRGVIGVGAANFSMFLQRSNAFAAYFALLKVAYPGDLERAAGFGLIQELWDRADPNGWYHRALDNPLPATPAHRLLVHMASNDAEVPNLGTQVVVRSLGIPQLTPVVRSYWGIDEATAPVDGSAMLESDGGYPPVPLTNTPPPGNAAHEGMRDYAAIQAQISAFFQPGGVIEQHCSGVCDPE